MKVLITGGCGFLGANLASFFLKNNHEVFLIDALFRDGSNENLKWLEEKYLKSDLKFSKIDISNFKDVKTFFREYAPFDYICHVAGQVTMTKSLSDPRSDLETNVIGTFNILESMREFSPEALLAFSSTNKVYGDLKWLEIVEKGKRYILEGFVKGLDEQLPLDFSTPYGCSKGAADQYVRDWARVFNLKTVVFRHSSIYGGRQYATYDQGWIGWFCKKVIEQKQSCVNGMNKNEFTISGTGKQVRDVLYADDLVNLYFSAYLNKEKMNGETFNIGGGYDNSLSILELIDILKEKLNFEDVLYKNIARRESDQDYFIASIEKAKKLLNWVPKIDKNEGIDKMIDWTLNLKKK